MTAKKQKTMSEKIVVQKRDHEKVSRIVGTIFIAVGAILVGLGVYSFITYKGEPELNQELKTPVLRELSSVTDDKIVELSGTAEGVDKVRIFVNDAVINTVKVEDGKFSYDWEIEDEGIYTLSVDGLSGFPKQKKSEMSEITFLTVDWTPPSSNVSFDYPEESSKETVTIKGIIDPDTTLLLKRGTQSYAEISDEEGNISLEIELVDEGKNVFSVILQDEAGNQIILDEKIRITYSPSGSVNGDGTTDSEIPEAAGNLADAMNEILNNRLMAVFGILALATMTITTVILSRRKRELS